jgi:hypothetical protein
MKVLCISLVKLSVSAVKHNALLVLVPPNEFNFRIFQSMNDWIEGRNTELNVSLRIAISNTIFIVQVFGLMALTSHYRRVHDNWFIYVWLYNNFMLYLIPCKRPKRETTTSAGFCYFDISIYNRKQRNVCIFYTNDSELLHFKMRTWHAKIRTFISICKYVPQRLHICMWISVICVL